jgi:hypothetical protein
VAPYVARDDDDDDCDDDDDDDGNEDGAATTARSAAIPEVAEAVSSSSSSIIPVLFVPAFARVREGAPKLYTGEDSTEALRTLRSRLHVLCWNLSCSIRSASDRSSSNVVMLRSEPNSAGTRMT